MAPPSLVPPKNVLERWRREGYTQKQMVELTFQEYGNVVSRSAIAAAMARYGLSEDGKRYEEYVPWRVSSEHATANPLRMLRLLARDHAGEELNAKERGMLDSWWKAMRQNEWIVGYDPDDIKGFHYIDDMYRDHDDPDIPIRRKRLRVANPRHARN